MDDGAETEYEKKETDQNVLNLSKFNLSVAFRKSALRTLEGGSLFYSSLIAETAFDICEGNLRAKPGDML